MCMNKTAKSILLSNSFEKLASVYSAEVLEKLESTAELDTTFRNKAMILADKASVADTEYIFSTWGMPVFDEAEIAACFPKLKAVFYAAGSVQEFARPFLNAHIKVFSAWRPMPCRLPSIRQPKSFWAEMLFCGVAAV